MPKLPETTVLDLPVDVALEIKPFYNNLILLHESMVISHCAVVQLLPFCLTFSYYSVINSRGMHLASINDLTYKVSPFTRRHICDKR